MTKVLLSKVTENETQHSGESCEKLRKMDGGLGMVLGKMGGIWRLRGREKIFMFCLEIAPIVSNCSGIALELSRITLEIVPNGMPNCLNCAELRGWFLF